MTLFSTEVFINSLFGPLAPIVNRSQSSDFENE